MSNLRVRALQDAERGTVKIQVFPKGDEPPIELEMADASFAILKIQAHMAGLSLEAFLLRWWMRRDRADRDKKPDAKA